MPLEVRFEDAIVLTFERGDRRHRLADGLEPHSEGGLPLCSTWAAISTTDPAVFQNIFGMIFTVIIALEFRRTLLVITERQQSIVHVRAVILVAMLAIVRKLIVLDLTSGGSEELFALAAAILALGGVYWLVRDVDRRAST